VFLDETGLMLQPLVRRTWAPQGQTPVMYSWDRHDRLSVIAALSLAAQRRRIGLYFAVHEKNVKAEEVEAFLRQVQRSLGRKLIVVMDRWAVHRKAAKNLFGDQRFWIEWLPPYAPDLNPVEQVWSQTKYGDLANYIPDDVLDLQLEFDIAMDRLKDTPELLRSFYHGAELEL
jgi:putative transposase